MPPFPVKKGGTSARVRLIIAASHLLGASKAPKCRPPRLLTLCVCTYVFHLVGNSCQLLAG